jgi:hypothetical protein
MGAIRGTGDLTYWVWNKKLNTGEPSTHAYFRCARSAP